MLAIARPEREGVLRKNHEARLISWTPAGKHFFPQEQGDSDVGAPGWAPDGSAFICGITGGSPSGFLLPPIVFAPNALSPWSQVCFSEKSGTAKVKVGKIED